MADSLPAVVTSGETSHKVARSCVIGIFSLCVTSLALAAETRRFDIAAQPADVALNDFALQAQVSLLFVAEEVRGITSNELRGEYTAEGALEALLAGTGLAGRINEWGVLTVAAVQNVPVPGTTPDTGTDTVTTHPTTQSRVGALLTALATALFGAGAVAEEGTGRASADSDRLIEEIVVTANRRQENTQEVAMSINAYGADRIQDSGIEALSDVQFLTAGLKIGEVNTASVITIRGIGQQQLVEGAETGAAVHQDGIFLSNRLDQAKQLFDIERIEVLRGPQGTLYGRNATGGAINFITGSPGSEFDGGFSVTAGDYKLLQTEGHVSGPIAGDTLMGRFAFKTVARDGYTENILDGDPYDNVDVSAFRAKLKYEPSDRFSLDVSADYSKQKGVTSPLLERLNHDVPLALEGVGAIIPSALGNLEDRKIAFNVNGRGVIEITGFAAHLTWDFDNLTLKSSTGHRDTFISKTYDVDFSQLDFAFFGPSFVETTHVSQEFNLSSTWEGPLQFVAGVFYFDQENPNGLSAYTHVVITPEFWFRVPIEAANDLLDTRAWAAYGEVDYHFNERWKVTVGARFSDEEKKMKSTLTILGNPQAEDLTDSWDSFTPKISLSYFQSDDVMWYATVARGFKGGGFLPFGFQDGFAPEIVTNYEVGINSLLLNGRLRFNGSLFSMDYTDLQVFQVADLPGDDGGFITINRVTNAGETTINGVELEMDWAPTDRLVFRANVSLLDATYGKLILESLSGVGTEDVSGNQQTGAPERSVNLMAQYEFPVGAWGTARVQAEYAHQSRVYFVPTNEKVASQAPFGQFNLRVILDDSAERWQYALYAENVNDEVIVAHQNITNGGDSIQNNLLAPRNYGISISARF